MKINTKTSKGFQHLLNATEIALNENKLHENTRCQLYAMVKLNLLNMSNDDLMELARFLRYPSQSLIEKEYENLQHELEQIKRTLPQWLYLVPAVYEAGAKATKYQVLIIENKLDMVVALISTFRRAGYLTRYVDSYEQALSRITDVKPDIIILSCDLPDIDGFWACKTLHRVFNVPIMLIGNQFNEKSLADAKCSEADCYEHPPYQWMIIPAIAKAIIRRYEQKSTML